MFFPKRAAEFLADSSFRSENPATAVEMQSNESSGTMMAFFMAGWGCRGCLRQDGS